MHEIQKQTEVPNEKTDHSLKKADSLKVCDDEAVRSKVEMSKVPVVTSNVQTDAVLSQTQVKLQNVFLGCETKLFN